MVEAVAVHNVSKVYQLGTISSETVTDDLNRWWARVRRRPDPLTQVGGRARLVGTNYWALHDVSFSVGEGEVVGVIGVNGAGKSTLLKILSRVTAPSGGVIKMRGRVASLLEVGTGFHPDLTGRENIFLNGAILGMSKTDIARNFDEIVAFSECESFIDTPVKRYSSGMYVRLAFAVAAHLDPEILIVDEVLAVGDAQFQRKCLGKMRDAAGSGRTVLFVSHSMAAVSALCSRAILLKDGRVFTQGEAKAVVRAYQQQSVTQPANGLDQLPRAGTGKARFRDVHIETLGTRASQRSVIVAGSDVLVRLRIECLQDFAPANVALGINDAGGYRLIDVNTALNGEFLEMRRGEWATVTFVIRNIRLRTGSYPMDLYIGRSNIEKIDFIAGARTLTVSTGSGVSHSEEFAGVYRCEFDHAIEREHATRDMANVS